MFQNFTIKYFRCFGGLHLQPLARVNLIAGKNNAGKTALLEAIRLHCDPGNAELPIKINEERGIKTPSFEEVCGWLFYDHEAPTIELSSQDDKGSTRIRSISVVNIATARKQFSEGDKLLLEDLPIKNWDPNEKLIVVTYRGPNEEEKSIGAFNTSKGMSGWVSKITWSTPCELVGSGLPEATRDVNQFSKLEIENHLDELLPSLRILEPRLQKLSLAIFSGKPMIHGHVGLSKQIPVAFMGEGLQRLLSILLALLTAEKGGIVLIDEIENGLHHSVLKNVWQAIAETARQADVQVFATTHSYFCIDAAYEAFKASGPYDLSLHRLDRVADHEFRDVAYDEETCRRR